MEAIDGVINLHKPTGITSAKALYRVRSISRMRKSGHTGTLDPMASGVLVLCVGKATKLVERMMDQPKVYRATARLDATSDSFDSEGDVRPVDVPAIPSREQVEAALNAFEGTIQQVPPAVSALKIGGVPAYKLARDQKAPVLQARPVRIYWAHLHDYDWPNVDFEVACGRGTYVRSIIRDLGESLHSGGCLTSLVRKAVGPFTLDNAWTFENLQTAAPERYILPLAEVQRLLQQAEESASIPARPG